MRKTQKSTLLKELQMDGTLTDTLLPSALVLIHTCFIVDLMALVQTIKKGSSTTFGDIAANLFNRIKVWYEYADTLVIAPDRYDLTDSIKSFERSRRSTVCSRERIIHNELTAPPSNFKEYLTNPKNKSNFVAFFLNFIIKKMKYDIKEEQALIVGKIDGTTWEVTTENVSEIEELKCDHEEADSRIFVYASFLCNNRNLNRVIIMSPDTDVAVIACYQYYNAINTCTELWFLTGHGTNRRFIPIHTIADSLGASICNLLPVFHSLTGCDSTASFSGKGKRKAFTILKKKKNDLLSLHDLGDNPTADPDSEMIKDAIKFICWLYDSEFKSVDVNILRYQLFCKKNISGEKLPPTYENLICHIARATYQTYIWKNAYKPLLQLPKPTETMGWIETNGILNHRYSNKDPAPKQLFEMVVCSCKSGCESKRCTCRKHNFACSNACSCTSCENDYDQNDQYNVEDFDDDDTNDEYSDTE